MVNEKFIESFPNNKHLKFSSNWDKIVLLIATWPLGAELREGRCSFVYYCASLLIENLLGFFVSG